MNILIVHNALLPVTGYGGTERVIWYLGKELAKMGHKVSYLAKEGSQCNFAKIIPYDSTKPYSVQIPDHIDIVHFNGEPREDIEKPYIVTRHGNGVEELNINTVFVSKNHAERYGSTSYVYNGMDWDDYGKVDLRNTRNYFHFLGNAGWRVKNIKGAIKTILSMPEEKLAVLGGTRLNFRMGFRFTLSPRIKFYGTVGGQKKLDLLQGSKGLVFPVRWHEPFGIAITESLYFGCPVFGTPYGSLPELVGNEVGYLSNKSEELANALMHVDSYSHKHCHEYAKDCFNSKKMALEYIEKYDQVVNGKTLNATNPQLKEIQNVKFLDWK